VRGGAGRRRLVGIVAIGLLAGCAAVRLEGGSYVVRGKGYRVAAPAGWERIASDADLALGRPTLGAGLMAHGTCDGHGADRTLPILARHLRFGLRDVTALEEAPVVVAGQPGIETRFEARLNGAAVGVRAVTLQGPRCVYDLVAVAPPDELAAVIPDFERFTASFVLAPERP